MSRPRRWSHSRSTPGDAALHEPPFPSLFWSSVGVEPILIVVHFPSMPWRSVEVSREIEIHSGCHDLPWRRISHNRATCSWREGRDVCSDYNHARWDRTKSRDQRRRPHDLRHGGVGTEIRERRLQCRILGQGPRRRQTSGPMKHARRRLALLQISRLSSAPTIECEARSAPSPNFGDRKLHRHCPRRRRPTEHSVRKLSRRAHAASAATSRVT